MPANDGTKVIVVRDVRPVTIVRAPPPPINVVVAAQVIAQTTVEEPPCVIVSECNDTGGSAIDVPPIPFSFGDAPGAVWTAPVAGVFTIARCNVTEAFNSASPTIKVGTDADPESLIPAAYIDAKSVADYENSPDVEVAMGDHVHLAIAPDGATRGTGLLLINFKPLS